MDYKKIQFVSILSLNIVIVWDLGYYVSYS